MMIIAGTIPVQDLPLTFGEVKTAGELLAVDGKVFGCTQGTGAMISAALTATTYLKLDAPKVLIAGDIGTGKGSREIYQYLIDNIDRLSPQILALHYWLPDMAQTRQLCSVIDNCRQRPLLIADAASMYAAKAAGLAEKFDVFTPDATEIAFLADPNATHPAYIAKHLFETDIRQAPELAETAFKNHGTAKTMLIKGSTDYVFQNGKIIAEINEPDIPAMEAIGGTGDTITGLMAALIYTGLEPKEAAVIAARANRMAGKYAAVTPASKVKQVIDCFPLVFKDNLCQWSNICYVKGGE
jgi:ADP-dependent NAD(P)H-hydrate dehydratase / NAD(P)H-hydrate epimerase